MMRYIINIILSFVLLSATSGIVINKHYSNGELYSSSLYSNPESWCNNADDHSNSCHEESEMYKISNLIHSSFQKIFNPNLSAHIHKANSSLNLFKKTIVFQNTIYQSKLSLYKIPLRELLQVFIIWKYNDESSRFPCHFPWYITTAEW